MLLDTLDFRAGGLIKEGAWVWGQSRDSGFSIVKGPVIGGVGHWNQALFAVFAKLA